jgi:predicted RNA-binding protein with PUA-like domain
MAKRYWLFKSEPGCFSFQHLVKSPKKTTYWDGVRNYQARNMLRDDVQVGDGILFYHSNAEPPGIAGIAEVVKAGYPDWTAFEKGHEHFDPKSDKANPAWYMVDIRAVEAIEPLLALPDLRDVPKLKQMELLRKGSRLSVQPVRPEEWATILQLAGVKGR